MPLSSDFQHLLPINRKEVYYTATVLPCIVCADGFKHIHRFWKLLGIDEVPPVHADGNAANIQFFTEYKALHSIYIETDKKRFIVESGEAPDLLILIDGPPPLIISIEAKMYDTVNKWALLEQLHDQRKNVLLPLSKGMPGARLKQIALVPREMSIDAEDFGSDLNLICWEEIVQEFADISSASYFCGVLDLALKNYRQLHSKKSLIFHANMEAKMTGEAILNGHGQDTFPFRIMGRSGGINGSLLANDLSSGDWHSQFYELNSQEIPVNSNWFTIESFLAKAGKTKSDVSPRHSSH